MKTLNFILILMTAMAASLWSASPLPPAISTENQLDAQNISLFYVSEAVAKGSQKNSAERRIDVYLPASYAQSGTRRYPVVYTFHGFGDGVSQMISAVKPLLAEGQAKQVEFIMVGIDGNNSRGGSFYANSTLTGNYEDMVTQEIVPLIDSRFRTIPESRARILAGYSMGGFAAWNLALAHAELFAGAWACCPGAFDENGLKDAVAIWNYSIKSAYGSAFAPRNPSPSRPPRFDGSPADQELVKLWESGFGNISGKLENYRQKAVALQEVRFDFGSNDGYDWIPRGSVYIAKAMAAAGIKASSVAHAAGHEITPTMLLQGFFPLAGRLFAGL